MVKTDDDMNNTVSAKGGDEVECNLGKNDTKNSVDESSTTSQDKDNTNTARQEEKEGKDPSCALSKRFSSSTLSACALFASYVYYYIEKQRQKNLTAPPLVFYQKTPQNVDLCQRMGLILKRPIRPSLVIGTSGMANSMAAYLKHGPKPKKEQLVRVEEDDEIEHDSISNNNINNSSVHNLDGPNIKANKKQQIIKGGGYLRNKSKHFHFREIMVMGSDGAEVAIDWELPDDYHDDSDNDKHEHYDLKTSIQKGPIKRPVVLILHGINNDASFGYIRSIMRGCTNKGWISAGFNFRGCSIPLKTPRGYNGAYTGDLRSVVNIISSRLSPESFMVLVGNSLGANLLVKYLGEEGLAMEQEQQEQTQQTSSIKKFPRHSSRIIGAISLGNPLVIHSGNISFPFGHILGLGLKRMLLQNYFSTFSKFNCPNFQKAFFRACFHTHTVGEFDQAIAPYLIRNDSISSPPSSSSAKAKASKANNGEDCDGWTVHTTRIGYQNAEEYWSDASSYKHLNSIKVPLLKIYARDDMLVKGPAARKLRDCVQNPNIIVLKTKSGGHLGWHHVDNEGSGEIGKSWADKAVTNFIQAVIQKREEEAFWKEYNNNNNSQKKNSISSLSDADAKMKQKRKELVENAKRELLEQPLQSRL